MSGWLVLALGAPTKTLALRKGIAKGHSRGARHTAWEAVLRAVTGAGVAGKSLCTTRRLSN